MSFTYGRKQKAAAMAACRWGNLEKVTVEDFQCQVGNGNVKDAETQTEISFALSSPTNFKENSVSAASSTAPKLADYFCDETVRPRDTVSFNCPSVPEKLQCLDITQINEAIEATKLQPLSQDSMEQQTVSKEACKSSLQAALSQEFHSYIKNASHSIENLTDNAELETCDGQLLLTTSTSLENLVNCDLSNLQHCECEKETELEFCSVKQNTVEEFEFECSRCGKKVNIKNSTPVVKATTRPRSAVRNIVALSFLVNGQYFKDYHKILGTLGLDHVSSTQWIHIVEWIAPFVKTIADRARSKNRSSSTWKLKSSLHIQFDGFYLTRGHYSNNSSATVHDAKTGKIIAYSHRTKRGQGANWEGTSGGAEGNMFGEMLEDLLGTFSVNKCIMDNDSSCQEILLAKSPDTEIVICGNHRAKTFHADLQKVKNTPCQLSCYSRALGGGGGAHKMPNVLYFSEGILVKIHAEFTCFKYEDKKWETH